jgi:mycobactin peptide synthetase MbtE
MAYTEGDRIEVLVDLAAQQRPDAVAIRRGEEAITYRDLIASANQVARALTAAGVAAGDVVAVRAERTVDTMVALLGLLKAGAVYACCPVDWPLGRYRQLVEQTGPTLCLAPSDDEPMDGVPTLTVRALLAASTAHPTTSPAPAGRGTDPFCVFLTSGSTGRPKAVLAPHRGVARTALDVRRLSDGPVTALQQASMAWDVFALELWVTLVNGGTCVLSDTHYLSGPRLRELVRGGVDTLAAPTPLFTTLVEDDIGSLAGLRLIYVGGERLTADHVRRCVRAHPALRLVNAYGPVENTVNTTLWVAGEDGLSAGVPIGTPVANTSVYLLDEQHQVVPVGETGELAIGGDGVSLGYLGAPEETARRFVTVEPEGEPVRLYLTGDLATVGDDGQLLFAGRRDRQLKVRGLRIEAEEIERLVESVPGVARCVVLALPLDAPAKTRLAAFHLSAEAGVSTELIRRTVAATVPPGSVPDVFLGVERFPLNANGKVDQRALADLLTSEDADNGTEADPVVAAVRDTAAELLGYRVRSDDDVFDRGATSLTAMRMATRLSSAFSRTVDVSDIFRARTPGRIAEVIRRAAAQETLAAGFADPGPDVGYQPTALPFIFGSFWAAMRSGSTLDEALVPIVYQLRGPVRDDVLRTALDRLVARHEVLRVRFGDDYDRPEIRVLPASETVGLLEQMDPSSSLTDATRTATQWAMRPFDLTTGGPIRAGLFPAGDDEAVLAVSAHHIFFDGWSARLFSQELAETYLALLDDPAQAPGPQPPSYFRVIATQREQYRERFPVAVWTRRQQMADAPELTFPLSGSRPWSGPAAEVPLAITPALLAEVGTAAAAVQGTAMAVFYAAYVQLLRDYTGAPDPAVAVPVSGRYSEEETNLVGCMASLLPLRLPAAATTPPELVVAAAHELQAAMSPPLVPMAAIMPTLAPGYRRHPLLQAYLLQEELPPATLSLGDVVADLVRSPSTNAVPEITVELWPHPAVGGVLRYRTDAIPEQDARELAEQFVENVRGTVRQLSGRR